MGQSILQGNGGGSNKQFISAGGNPNFAGCSFVAYDGKQFAPNSGYGTFGKTYNPLNWCSVGANTSYGERGHRITITITKACTVSVFSFRNSMQSTDNGTVTSILNEYAEVGKTYTILHDGYNQGIGITVVKED